MRMAGLMGLIGAAAISCIPAAVALQAPPIGGFADAGGVRRVRRGKGQNNRRGGKPTRAAKRSNRLTISKRVKRKHRRAAK